MTYWNQEKTIRLIEEFHARPALWDVTCSEYKNRNKKRDALQELANHFQTSIEELEKKLKNLKVQFRREHKALCLRKKSGSSPKKAGWFGYDLLLFLLDNSESRGSRNTFTDQDDINHQEESDFQEDDDLTEINESQSIIPQGLTVHNPNSTSADPTAVTPTRTFCAPLPKDNKKRRQEQADEAFKTMKDIKENSLKRDEFSVFGELVANKLRKFANYPRNVAVAQHRINDILFNLEMEHYTTDRYATGSQPNTGVPVTFGGQLTSNPYHQYNSPSNTSTTSSPSLTNDSALNFHQQGSGFSHMSSRSCSPLDSMSHFGTHYTTLLPANEKPTFLTNQGMTESSHSTSPYNVGGTQPFHKNQDE